MKAEHGVPDVARRHDTIVTRHAELIHMAKDERATRDELRELAELESALQRFRTACTRHARHCLMATGLIWGDELRNPVADGIVARVRLADRVVVDGAEMTIEAATRIVAKAAGRGAAIADWKGAGIRLGDALSLEHPSAPKAVESEAGTNYQLL